MAHFDLSEVRDLARDLGNTRENAQKGARHYVSDAADRVVTQWKRNIREIDLPHGNRYGETIGYDAPEWTGRAWVAIVGPDSSLPQGGMGTGFEYGSINQDSPHMEGHRAADSEEGRFVRDSRSFARNVLWAGIRK